MSRMTEYSLWMPLALGSTGKAIKTSLMFETGGRLDSRARDWPLRRDTGSSARSNFQVV